MGFHSPSAPMTGLAACTPAALSISAQAALNRIDLDTNVDIVISSILIFMLEKLEQGLASESCSTGLLLTPLCAGRACRARPRSPAVPRDRCSTWGARAALCANADA